MARPQGTVKKVNNSRVRDYLKAIQLQGCYDHESFTRVCPSWVDDCLVGASMQTDSDKPMSAYRIFSMLCLLPIISTVTVREILDRKRMAVEGIGYSEQWVRYVTGVLRCANGSISLYMDNNNVKIPKTTEPKANKAPVFTTEQKAKIRKLAMAGKSKKMSKYMAKCTKKNLKSKPSQEPLAPTGSKKLSAKKATKALHKSMGRKNKKVKPDSRTPPWK